MIGAAVKGHAWQMVALGLAGLLLWQTLHRHAAELDAANTHVTLSSERAANESSARRQAERYRTLEGNHRDDIAKITADASTVNAAAVGDAIRARAAHDRLQRDVAEFLTAHRVAAQARAAAGDGAPDSAALDLLADLRRRADERAGELAEIADRARISGTACERAYDSAHALSVAAQQP